MQLATWIYKESSWQREGGALEDADASKAQIVFLFGDTDVIKDPVHVKEMKKLYPGAHIVGASSSGNILGPQIVTAPLCATVLYLERSNVAVSTVTLTSEDSIEERAKMLVAQLPKEGLKHIFVLSEGLLINGSQLVRGINAVVDGVSVTGGLAGDGARFEHTYVIGDGEPREQCITAIGFYGEALTISSGCHGGWSEFGSVRTITKSRDNVLFEIDGEPALDLYKRYLGDQAKELPNSGLRFPLSIRADQHGPEVIRTLLTVNEAEKSITFAGDVPEGYSARLMKPDLEVLIDGAGIAAEEIERANSRTALGLVVSCVGRKIVMNQLIDDELEAVEEILGENVQLSGFYSYGEIAPFSEDIRSCQLHNQTMTLTVVYES